MIYSACVKDNVDVSDDLWFGGVERWIVPEHQFLPTLPSDASREAARARRQYPHFALDVHQVVSGRHSTVCLSACLSVCLN